MDGKPPAVHIISLITQEVEKLRVEDRHNKVESVVRIGNDNEQRRFAVAYGVKLHFVGFHEFAQFPNIERGKPRTAGNQNAFCGLS